MKNSIPIIICIVLIQLGCKTQNNLFPRTSVATYLNQLVDSMEANHINRKNIDWTSLRTAVQEKGAGLSTISEADESILLALELLNDQTSFVVKAFGGILTYSTPCTATKPADVVITADVGYIKIPPFSNVGVSAAVFAEKMHGEIRDQDNEDKKGWIIDLRENTGGNLWPMVGGIGPILGNGTAGYFVDSNGGKKPFGYKDGSATFNDKAIVTVSFPYTLKSPNSKIAILVDHSTTNAGEAVAVAFSGKTNTRSFGAVTCGKAGGNQAYQLSDGSVLYLTTAFLIDRNEANKQGELQPDEIVDDPQMVFNKAVEWINQ